MNIFAGLGSGNPFAGAIGCGGSAVNAGRPLDHYVRALLKLVGEPRCNQLNAFIAKNIANYFNTSLFKSEAATALGFTWVVGAKGNFLHTRFNQRLRTRPSLAGVVARLKSYNRC